MKTVQVILLGLLFGIGQVSVSVAAEVKRTASDGAATDYFGYSVSISGDYAIVSAYLDDDDGKSVGFLQPLTKKTITQENARLLAQWRQENSFAFPSSFKITVAGTKRWLESQVINNKGRILFFVIGPDDDVVVAQYVDIENRAQGASSAAGRASRRCQ